MNRGVLFGLLCYVLWGLLPIYWNALSSVPSLQILSHRIVWSIFWLALWITFLRKWSALTAIFRRPRLLRTLAIASVLLTFNWGLYIWAVNNGKVVETSLGYFINPLFNVLLGVIFFGERLRRLQIGAVVLAAIGVLYLTLTLGEPPWISLALAASFAIYALLKKRSDLGATEGLFVETGVVAGFALAYLVWVEIDGQAAFGHTTWDQNALLIFAGAVTALPLVLFAAAARRIPLTLIGFLQYTSPTIQFLLGVFYFQEPFSVEKLVGFCFIWSALILFSMDGFLRSRNMSTRALAT